MIDAELLKTVRFRALTSVALLLLSVASLIIAIVIQDGSMMIKSMGFFGGIGTIVFWLISGSELDALKRARNGEAPYAE